MSLYNGPPRPGARGGRAEFSWDNVKSDKDREFYLGHSVKASVGRWQKGKDLTWYAKGKNDMGVTQEELAAVKAREREMMAEALGLKPKSAGPSSLTQPSLEQHEVERLLKGADQEPAAAGAPDGDAERVKGLGFSSGAAVAVREEVREVLPGTALPGVQTAGAAAGKLLTVDQLAAMEKASAAAGGRDSGRLLKKQKKAKKEKREKRDKDKKHKKDKKRHKRKARSHSRSSESRSQSSSDDEAARDRPHQQQHSWQHRSSPTQHNRWEDERWRELPPRQSSRPTGDGSRHADHRRGEASRERLYGAATGDSHRGSARGEGGGYGRDEGRGRARIGETVRGKDTSSRGYRSRSRSRSPARRHLHHS